MKRNITKKQWNELSQSQSDIILRALNFPFVPTHCWARITVGLMIEFLGDDLSEIKNTDDGWVINFFMEDDISICNTLCDALWEAVRCKINENN